MSKKPIICLAGGSGFIGRNVKKYLESTNKYEIWNFSRIHQVSDTTVYASDIIVNCVGETKDLDNMVSANLIFPLQLMRAAKEFNKPFLHLGSAVETGHPMGVISESTISTPTNLYQSTKAGFTEVCYNYAEQFKLNFLILRLATVYGEDDKDYSMLKTLWRCFKEDKEFQCLTESRDWIHVEDVAVAVEKAIDKQLASKKTPLYDKIINIGTGISTKNTDIVDWFEEMVGKKLNVKKLSSFNEWYLDTTIAFQDLEFEAKILPKEGVNRFVMNEWFNEEQSTGL